MNKDFHPSFKYGIDTYIYADVDFTVQKDISNSDNYWSNKHVPSICLLYLFVTAHTTYHTK